MRSRQSNEPLSFHLEEMDLYLKDDFLNDLHLERQPDEFFDFVKRIYMIRHPTKHIAKQSLIDQILSQFSRETSWKSIF